MTIAAGGDAISEPFVAAEAQSSQRVSCFHYASGYRRTATTSFFEEKYKGPDAVMIDTTPHGWVGAQAPANAAQKINEADEKVVSV